MGHYSNVYFGYNTEVADKVEKLWRKRLGNEPAAFFDEEFMGHWHNYSATPRSMIPNSWIIVSTKQTKWYDSYEPEGKINKIVEYMNDHPDVFSTGDWFWVRTGEQFPAELSDFVYYGNTGESPFEWEIGLKEWEGSSGSGIRWVNREEFDADLEPIMPYAYGTINYAYIERWVEYNNKEHRIIPDDEIWS
jgi:hypothetical protein